MDNIKCRAIEPLLDGYFDNELSPNELASVQSHLTNCDDCSGKLAEIVMVSKGLSSMPKVSLGKDLSQAILLKAQAKPQTKGQVLTFKRMAIWAAAACLILGLSFQFLNKPAVKVSSLSGVEPAKVVPTQPVKVARTPSVRKLMQRKLAAAPQSNEVAPKPEAKINQQQKQKTLIAGSAHDEVLAFDDGYQPSLMEGMGMATDEDGLYALKM